MTKRKGGFYCEAVTGNKFVPNGWHWPWPLIKNASTKHSTCILTFFFFFFQQWNIFNFSKRLMEQEREAWVGCEMKSCRRHLQLLNKVTFTVSLCRKLLTVCAAWNQIMAAITTDWLLYSKNVCLTVNGYIFSLLLLFWQSSCSRSFCCSIKPRLMLTTGQINQNWNLKDQTFKIIVLHSCFSFRNHLKTLPINVKSMTVTKTAWKHEIFFLCVTAKIKHSTQASISGGEEGTGPPQYI